MTRDELLIELRYAIEAIESRLEYNKRKLEYYERTQPFYNKIYIESIKEQIEIEVSLIHTLKASKDLIERKVVR